MSVNKIINYTLNKLFFPKVVTIDKPGIIYTIADRKFGSPSVKKRIIWYFEDPMISLQQETIKTMGKKQCSELWYRIGKDVGTEFMLLSKIRKIPSFLLPSVLDTISNRLKSAGFTALGNFEYIPKNKSIVFYGKNNIICRNTQDGEVFAGIISGIFSFLIGENIEGKLACKNCPNFCKIIADKDIPFRYRPDFDELKPSKIYDKLNFPNQIDRTGNTDSFGNLLKFKIVRLDDSGRFYFENKVISPTTADFLGLIVNHYLKIDKESVLKKGVIDGAEKLASDLLDKKTINKIGYLKTVLSSFGWGIPNVEKVNKKIILDLLYPPITEYGFLYQVFFINGFLNYIFKKEFKNFEILLKKDIPQLQIVYK